jgi:hypothetical protein
MIEAELANRIGTLAETRLRPAADSDLAKLQALGLPAIVVEFYRSYEPAQYAEIQGVRLWPISEVIEENQRYVPGADVCPQGFVVFASTVSGDAYCFDLTMTEPRVVLLSHEVAFEGMARPQIQALAKPIAPNFDSFLSSFAAGTLESEPLDGPSS